MGTDLDILRAIESGERNLEAKQLIENWCRHARVEKNGGTGMIEMQTGLPIGYHSMVCDHAPAGGIATWLLEESAIHFHDNHCVGCTKRQPVRLPNLSKLIAQRDKELKKTAEHNKELQRQREAAFTVRCSARLALRLASSVPVATFLDDLEAFDKQQDDAAAQRLIECVRLAPEILTTEVIDHIFSLLENGEDWFDSVGLTILNNSNVDPARLCHCAMLCLKDGRELDLSAEIIDRLVSYVEAEDVRPAVCALIYVASPPLGPLEFDDDKLKNSAPLKRIFQCFPVEVCLGVNDLLSERDPFPVRLGARAIATLVPEGLSVSDVILRSLITKLSRADSLIDLTSDSELRDVVQDLTKAANSVFLSDPVRSDTVLMQYFESASQDGEARLIDVYERIIRQANKTGDTDGTLSSIDACRTALRRLLVLAGSSENQGVIREILEALRNKPGCLAPIASEQMDVLLGTAALIDTKLNISAEPATIITNADSLASLEKESRFNTLFSLRAALLNWAIHGAKANPESLAAFVNLLDKMSSASNSLYAAIIRQLSVLMSSAVGLNAVLPFLYSGMVGRSNLVRSAATSAIGELGPRRFNELPELVFEAFLLMIADRYVIVHQAAVRVLTKIDIPSQFRDQVLALLWNWIHAYRGDKNEGFLLECMEAFASESGEELQLNPKLGHFFISVLRDVKPKVLIANEHKWLLRRLAKVDGYAVLVTGLFKHCEYDYELERVLELVREIPEGTGHHFPLLRQVVANDPLNGAVVSTFLEVFTRDGDWAEGYEVTKMHFDAVPNTTRMRSRWLIALQQRCRAEFEFLISQGNVEQALAVGRAWDEAAKEIIQINEKNEKSNPFRPFFRSS